MRDSALVLVASLCLFAACRREAPPPERLHTSVRSHFSRSTTTWDWVDGGLELTWSTEEGASQHHRLTPTARQWAELYREMDAESAWGASSHPSGLTDQPSIHVELAAEGKSLKASGTGVGRPLFEWLQKVHDAADGGVRLEPDREGTARLPY